MKRFLIFSVLILLGDSFFLAAAKIDHFISHVLFAIGSGILVGTGTMFSEPIKGWLKWE